MSQCSISCELHDYLEIACMYGYRVKLTIKGHQTIEGKAIDTLTTAEKREYLVIDNGHEQQQIELNQLYSAINCNTKVSQAPHPEQAPVFLDMMSRSLLPISRSALIFP